LKSSPPDPRDQLADQLRDLFRLPSPLQQQAQGLPKQGQSTDNTPLTITEAVNTPLSEAKKTTKASATIIAIRQFRGLKDGSEDLEEYIKDIDTKQSWELLKDRFPKAFPRVVKDDQSRKFELKVRMGTLSQHDTESIAVYIDRCKELATQLPDESIEVGMATLKGMRDPQKRERCSFECTKDNDYSFPKVVRLIKAAYTEIGKGNPFDNTRQESLQVSLPGPSSAQTIEELLKQCLINTSSALPAILQGIRAIGPRPSLQAAGEAKPIFPTPSGQFNPYKKRDLSGVKCYVCGEMGHFASLHDKQQPPAITANAILTEAYNNARPEDRAQLEAALYHIQDEQASGPATNTLAGCAIVEPE
ncbi:MAG: hypothetical protein Q9174_007424, partial [Haloplaca sp. 1 TL-2023]